MVLILLVLCLASIWAVVICTVLWIQSQRAKLTALVIEQKRLYSEMLTEFITAPDEQTPSPFAQLVVASLTSAIPRLANATAMSLKASLMGSAGAIAKGAQAVEMGLQAEMMSDNPMGQIAAGIMAKQIKKNPLLGLGIDQLTRRFAGAGAGPGNNNHNSGNGSGSPTKFNL